MLVVLLFSFENVFITKKSTRLGSNNTRRKKRQQTPQHDDVTTYNRSSAQRGALSGRLPLACRQRRRYAVQQLVPFCEDGALRCSSITGDVGRMIGRVLLDTRILRSRRRYILHAQKLFVVTWRRIDSKVRRSARIKIFAACSRCVGVRARSQNFDQTMFKRN
jgi:hypothetical protein